MDGHLDVGGSLGEVGLLDEVGLLAGDEGLLPGDVAC